MEELELDAGGLAAGSGRANRFVTRLVWLYGGFTVFLAAGLGIAFLPFVQMQTLRIQALEAVAGGVGALTLSTLLMALTMLCAVWTVAAARAHDARRAIVTGRFSALRQFGPGAAARQGQAI